MLWLWLYIATMFCIALPVAWFARNEVAATVFAVWGVGQVAYQLGAPEPQAQILLYGGAFAYLVIRRARGRLAIPDGSLVSVALFVPLFLVCVLWWRDATPVRDAWWGIWFLAMAQVAFLLRPIAWLGSTRRRLSRNYPVDHGGNLMVRA